MRPLFFDFPTDEQCHAVEDQYMFGPDILVAPVLEVGAVSSSIYLPEGAEWKDALTGKEYQGGQIIDYPVTLEHIPLFTHTDLDFNL